jgi:hypothetical protein
MQSKRLPQGGEGFYPNSEQRELAQEQRMIYIEVEKLFEQPRSCCDTRNLEEEYSSEIEQPRLCCDTRNLGEETYIKEVVGWELKNPGRSNGEIKEEDASLLGCGTALFIGAVITGECILYKFFSQYFNTQP